MNRKVPTDDGSSAEDRIDERCDAFEAAWRNGECPNICDFIRPEDGTYRKELFRELLLVDVERRRSRDEQPTPEFYLRMFPEFASEVLAVSLLHSATAFAQLQANGSAAMLAESKQPKSHIAHFELIERLGAGAMGEAWKAWDTLVKRYVTLKLPHSGWLAESDLRRFLREVEASGQLNHPQLAAVHSIEKDRDSFFIVAAFVEGDNLRDYASKKQLSDDEIVDICAGIGEALQHAHDAGVVHRDLKPANIIIDPNGLPHVIDFGLAKIRDAQQDLTLDGELLGTPAYMSPELASGGAAEADARTDVYSLGVMLYELLTGRCPFDGDRGSVIGQILACDPPPPRSVRASIPRDLETICRKAIEKAPEKRYTTAHDFAEDLRRHASGLPIRARRVGILEKCWRWIFRHPAITASVVLVAVAVIVSSAKIASLQRENKRLAGFRPVRITTTPSGAHVAIVPINPKTNEPDPDPAGVVRPTEVTPLVTELKSGTYLVEAVLLGGATPDFVEVYRTVEPAGIVPDPVVRTNKRLGLDPDTCIFRDIEILSQNVLINEMVQIVVPQEARRRNSLLPTKLYADASQTTPDELKLNKKLKWLLSASEKGDPCVSYRNANRWAELNQTRLPSAAEYDIIVGAVEHGEAQSVRTGEPARMEDLFDSYPEWSTTVCSDSRVTGNGMAAVHKMHVLKGFKFSNELVEFVRWIDGTFLADPDLRSPRVSVRGVRSATPRFVKP